MKGLILVYLELIVVIDAMVIIAALAVIDVIAIRAETHIICFI